MNDKHINDGGPAFPEAGPRGMAAGGEGMSLRDYFAARMMVCEIEREIRQHKPYNYLNAATRAYRMADAMLKAREVRND